MVGIHVLRALCLVSKLRLSMARGCQWVRLSDLNHRTNCRVLRHLAIPRFVSVQDLHAVDRVRIMKLGDCEVWIACDDEPLTEYAVTQEGSAGKQIACFVPSEAGKVGMLVFLSEWHFTPLILNHRNLRFTTKTTVQQTFCASPSDWMGRLIHPHGSVLVKQVVLGLYVLQQLHDAPISSLN